MTARVPWPLARERAHAAAAPLPPDTLSLDTLSLDTLSLDTLSLAGAAGGTLAGPLVAAASVPAFDAAAMDGYAVAGAGPWRVVRRILAGHGTPGTLAAGEAAEVATGAPVPGGTDAVLRYEDCRLDGQQVRGSGPLEPGRHVRRAGEDVPAGAELLPAGTPVTPVLLALAAAVGLDTLAVRRRARVVALITGDEVVHRGLPGGGRVRDAIGPLLPGVVARYGGELILRLPVPDHPPQELATAVDAARAEVVLACGATAAGPTDRLRAVLAELGARPVVDGVACRPGHPQSLSVLPDGRFVVGVPGNPFAALVACHTLLGPLLAGLAGRPLPALPHARLAGGGVPPDAADTRLVPVRWLDEAVTPVGHDGPGSLWGAAAADALAAVPPSWHGAPVPLLTPV